MNVRLSIAILGAAALMCSPVVAQEPGSAKLGQQLAETVCAECHAVGRDALRSPNRMAPTFEAVANMPGMTALAIRVWLRSAHREMPNLVLMPDEVDDVTAYLDTLRHP